MKHSQPLRSNQCKNTAILLQTAAYGKHKLKGKSTIKSRNFLLPSRIFVKSYLKICAFLTLLESSSSFPSITPSFQLCSRFEFKIKSAVLCIRMLKGMAKFFFLMNVLAVGFVFFYCEDDLLGLFSCTSGVYQ